MMRKRYVVAAVGMAGMGVITNYLLNSKRKNPLKKDRTLLEAGIPDQIEDEDLTQLEENANMVSEGSQYGVQYYNEVKEAEQIKDLQ